MEIDLSYVQRFLASPFRRGWLAIPTANGELHAYVRCGMHLFNGRVYRTFELANVEARPQRNGIFFAVTEALRVTLPRDRFDAIYVENVQPPFLRKHLESRGWSSNGAFPPSYLHSLAD